MKHWMSLFSIFALALLMAGCAPGAITPTPVYEGDGMSAGPYPASTRAGHPDEDGFYVSSGPVGLGLEVARGPWRGVLYASYNGAAGRVSWSQDAVGSSLDAAYNAYTTWDYVDTDGDGYPDTEVTRTVRTVGAALDTTYYFEVPTEIGWAYVGPRARAYFACTQEDTAPYVCDRYGVLPGGVLGINVPLGVFDGRMTLGFEGSLFMVIPGVTDRPTFSVFSPFAVSLSYRF